MEWVKFGVCVLFGIFGAHKFIEGDKKRGKLYLYTFGLFGIGWICDCVTYFLDALNGSGNRKTRCLSDNEPLPEMQSENVLLHKDEICHYIDQVTYVKTKNVVVGYDGGSSGINVRITKGISYRDSKSKTRSIRDDIQEKTDGLLTITNRRIVFSSTKCAFDKKISELTSILPHSDGLSLQFGDVQYSFMLKEPQYVYQILLKIARNSVDD